MDSLILRLLVVAVSVGVFAVLGAFIEVTTGVWPRIKDLPTANRQAYRLGTMALGIVVAIVSWWAVTGRLPW